MVNCSYTFRVRSGDWLVYLGTGVLAVIYIHLISYNISWRLVMTDKIIASGRRWLNPPRHRDTGAISWAVMATSYGDVESYITIRDCSRQIELDYCFEAGSKSKQQRLKKLNYMIEAFTAIRDSLDEAEAVTKELLDAYNKKKDEKSGEIKNSVGHSLRSLVL